MRAIRIRAMSLGAIVAMLALAAGGTPPAPTRRATRPTWAISSKVRKTTSTSGPSACKGMGDGTDKLVTIDVNPASSSTAR